MTITANRGELVRLEQSPLAYGYRGSEEPTDLIDFRDLWKQLRSRSQLAASVFSASMLAALLFLLIVPPTYTAVSVIHIDPRKQRVISSEAVLSGIGPDAAAVESQVELIRSTTAAAIVVKQLGLLNDPEFSRPPLIQLILKAVMPYWRDQDPVKTARQQRNEVIVRFLDHLTVRRRGLTYIIEVSFDSVDAEKASMVANAISDAYLNDQLAIKVDATSRASKWLMERIDALRDKVRDSEQAVTRYKAENNIIDIGAVNSGLTLNDRQLEQLNQQMISARAGAAAAKAKFDQVKRITEQDLDPGSLSDALSSDVISRLRVRYSTVARIESEYSAIYGPAHPKLTSIRLQLTTMRREIKLELGRIVASSKNESQIANSRVESLMASLRVLEQRSQKLNQANVRLAEIEREAQANRNLFEQFLSRAKETNEQRSMKNADARIVAKAMVPVQPSSPKKMIVLLVAAIGGLGLAMGSVFLCQNLDRSYRSKVDLERSTRVTCLGLCPAIKPRDVGMPMNGLSRHWPWLAKLLSRSARDGAIDDEAGFRQLVSRIVLDQSESLYADAIRSIRLGFTAAGPNLESKILLVSSALPGEGKSTIATNLAHSLAKSGSCTLLIDADTRGGSLSQLLSHSDAPGLSDVLAGQQSLSQTIMSDPSSSMFFMPTGRKSIDRDDSDMLINDRFRQFLKTCRDSFDYIVIDGPPVHSMAEGRFLYRYADEALFVVEAGKTDDEAVITAMEALGSMRGKIAGTILNKVDPDASESYRYEYSTGLS